jgi:hypothetical protein
LDSQARDSAAAEVALDGPAADPTEEPTTVLLRVFAEGDGFRWSAFYTVEGEDAPFNEGEIEWGSSIDLETAKKEAWDVAVIFLKDLGYEDREIGDAVRAGGAG